MNANIKKLHGKGFIINAFGNTWHGRFKVNQYTEGDRPAISGTSLTGEPLFMLTVNIPEAPLKDDEILVKTWSENEEIASEFLRQKYFEDTGKRVPTGFVQASIWRVL